MRKEAGDKDKDELTEMVELTAKISLNNAQRQRDLEAFLIENWTLPADHHIVKSMNEAGAKYAAAVEGKGADHPYGCPHIHKWKAMVAAAINEELWDPPLPVAGMEAPPIQQQAVTKLIAHQKDLDKLSVDLVGELVGLCRTKSKLEKKDQAKEVRIFFVIDPASCAGPQLATSALDVEVAMKVVLEAKGAKKAIGPVPPSMMEKRLSAILNKRAKHGKK